MELIITKLFTLKQAFYNNNIIIICVASHEWDHLYFPALQNKWKRLTRLQGLQSGQSSICLVSTPSWLDTSHFLKTFKGPNRQLQTYQIWRLTLPYETAHCTEAFMVQWWRVLTLITNSLTTASLSIVVTICEKASLLAEGPRVPSQVSFKFPHLSNWWAWYL